MEKTLYAIATKNQYPPEAFVFVQNGLDFTVRRIHGEPASERQDKSRHISGRDLCYGLRDYAIEQYGLMARGVLGRWGIHKCEDFGRIVFAMVEAKLMLKTDNDTLDDFANVFDFREAFSVQLSLSDKASVS